MIAQTSSFSRLIPFQRSFDKIAKRKKVFKVETVGDCYVAVAGLPDRNPNHAVVMVRFARDCLSKIDVLMKKLELVLGPGTGELSMRFGLHVSAKKRLRIARRRQSNRFSRYSRAQSQQECSGANDLGFNSLATL